MIDTILYNQILDQGLLLDHYILMCNIRDGNELGSNKRIQGFLNLLCKKEYIEDGTLTEKGLNLIGGVMAKEVKPTLRMKAGKKEERKFDYADWVIMLHRKLEARLIVGTGKKQYRAKLDGKGWSWLPNPTDLGRVLLRAIQSYKLTDFDKIEACLLRYTDLCIKKDKWFPILGYYIMKNNMSTMVTEMDSMEEEEDSPNDTIVNI
jgi:hypothetical protein